MGRPPSQQSDSDSLNGRFMVRVVSRQRRRQIVDIDFPIASSEADALRSALVWVARQRRVALADLQAEIVRRYPTPTGKAQ